MKRKYTFMQTRSDHSDRILIKMFFRNTSLIVLGSILYALSISLFLKPNQLAPGGISGIAIIMNHFSTWSIGLIVLILNIPIIILGLYKLKSRIMFNTIITTLLTSVLIDIFSLITPITDDPLLAALAGGGLMALGMTLIFKAEATTGGIDIIVRILRLSLPQFKSGTLFLLIDSIVITASAVAFQNVDKALYAALSVIIFSSLFDFLMYGGDSAKLIYIISANHDSIAHRLLYELGVGVTYLSGSGAYTQKGKQIIMCALKNHIFPKAHNIVIQEDPDAFFIVGQASEIYGEGFKDPGKLPL